MIPQLPTRPETLNDSQKDELDRFATKYLLTKSEEQEETIQINPKELAELDRDAELTTTEVNLGKELIEKNMPSKKIIYKNKILGSEKNGIY